MYRIHQDYKKNNSNYNIINNQYCFQYKWHKYFHRISYIFHFTRNIHLYNYIMGNLSFCNLLQNIEYNFQLNFHNQSIYNYIFGIFHQNLHNTHFCINNFQDFLGRNLIRNIHNTKNIHCIYSHTDILNMNHFLKIFQENMSCICPQVGRLNNHYYNDLYIHQPGLYKLHILRYHTINNCH